MLHCVSQAVTCLAAQSSSSRQPLLSCKPLHSLRLHFTPGLRSLYSAQHPSFHFGSIRFSHLQSTGCPSFARRYVATGCGAVMVFGANSHYGKFILAPGSCLLVIFFPKNPASPLLQAIAIPHTLSSYSRSGTGGSTRRRLAPKKTKRPQGIAPDLFF